MRRQLDALTGLRFFAALLVVVQHFAPRTGIAMLDNLAGHAFVAVTLFFVLSGFILTYSYMAADGHLNSSKRTFWLARFARIYPVYLLGLMLAAPRILFHIDSASEMRAVATSGISSLALLQAWHPATLWTWNTPGWSLSAEAFFYLVFPFIAPTIMRLGTRRLWQLLGCVWGLSMLANLFVLAGVDGLNVDFLRYSPIMRLPEFIAGIVMAKMWMTRTHKDAAMNRFYPAAAGVVLLGLLTLPADKAYFFNGSLLPVMMVLLYSLANARGGLATLLSTPACVKLGEASYALYILHWPIWDLAVFALNRAFQLPVKGAAIFWITLAIAVTTSRLVYVVIEKPANRYLRARFASKRADAAAISAANP